MSVKVAALLSVIACAGCTNTAKAEQTCPFGWASKADGCHDDKGNIWVNGGYRHDGKSINGWHMKYWNPANNQAKFTIHYKG